MPAGPQRLVITGGTKGVGRALAAKHLAAGDAVCVGARDAGRLEAALAELRAGPGGERAHGTPCDVGRAADVRALADFAAEEMGGIDGWVCNAGTNGGVYEPLRATDPALLEEVVRTNALGLLLSVREAARVMEAQPGGGHVFLMTGAGSTGTPTRLYAAYGFTKAGIPQLAKSLRAEFQGSAVKIHTVSPGLVFTDLLKPGDGKFGGLGNALVNVIGMYADDVADGLVRMFRETIAAEGGPLDLLTGGHRDLQGFDARAGVQRLFRRLAFGERKGEFFAE